LNDTERTAKHPMYLGFAMRQKSASPSFKNVFAPDSHSSLARVTKPEAFLLAFGESPSMAAAGHSRIRTIEGILADGSHLDSLERL